MTSLGRHDREEPKRDAGDDADVGELSGSIAETRGHLSATLDEIEDRLTPERIKAQAKEMVSEATEQAKDAVRDATIGRAETAIDEVGRTTRGVGRTMLDTIKQNPIPAALIGIGVGWLLFNGQSHNDADRLRTYDSRGSRRLDRQGRLWMSDYERYEAPDFGRSEGEREGNMTDRLQSGAGQVADQVHGTAGRVAGTVQDRMGDIQDRMGDLQDSTQQFASTAQDRIQDVMHDKPLLAGAVAVAAGMIVGLALPETEQENALLGEARDNLVEQVKETARETQGRIQNAAEQIGQAAQSGSQ